MDATQSMRSAGRMALTLALFSAFISVVEAHSWLEQLQAISNNGTFVGSMGYPRGYMARTDAGYNGDTMDYLIPALDTERTRINGSDHVCHPSQRTVNYSSAYPMLQVSPGGYVAMKYLENGHVTQPQIPPGKPKGAGSVFVYGTTSPSDQEMIVDVMKWTKDGKGGNGRGKLLTAQNFDDDRCHQLNTSPLSQQRQKDFPDRVPDQPTSNVEQWCETDLQVPTSSTIGEKLTIYWIWAWPTLPGVESAYPDGKDEYYSTCAELDIVAETNSTTGEESQAMYALTQQDPQTTACSEYMSRTAYSPTPTVILAGATSSSTATSIAAAVAVGESYSSTSSVPAFTFTPSSTADSVAAVAASQMITTTEMTTVTATTIVTVIGSPALTVDMTSTSTVDMVAAPTVGSDGVVGEKRDVTDMKRSAKFRV